MPAPTLPPRFVPPVRRTDGCLAGVLRGTALGAGLGLLGLAVGAVRAGTALAVSGSAGGDASAPGGAAAAFARLAATYVGGLALAGALAGGLASRGASRRRRYAALMAGGTVAVLVVSAGLYGAVRPRDFMVAGLLGPLFGAALARGYSGPSA